MKTQKFNRKTFQVDAVRVTKENMSAVAKWCQGEIQTENDGKKFIKVRVLRPLNEGQTKAFVGDWVLYAGTGYKVYTNKSFWTCFEKPQPKGGSRSRKGHPGGPTVVDEVRRMEKLYGGAMTELKKHSGPVANVVVKEADLQPNILVEDHIRSELKKEFHRKGLW